MTGEDLIALTARQREIHTFMRTYQAKNDRPPTLREIGARFGIASTNAISDFVRSLMKKGYVEKLAGVRCYMAVPINDEVTQSETPPWDTCTVSFGVDDPAAITRAESHGKLLLPTGWMFGGIAEPPRDEPPLTHTLYEDGQRRLWLQVAVFHTPPTPSPEDGAHVLALLRRVGARP